MIENSEERGGLGMVYEVRICDGSGELSGRSHFAKLCYNILMPNLTPFEIALLILCAVLVAALGVILWWHLAGDRVKALIAGWMALPLFWKIILPVVFAGVSAPALIKGDDDEARVVPDCEYAREFFAAGAALTPEFFESLMAANPVNPVNHVQLQNGISVSDEDIARGYRLESAITSKAGAA